MCRLLAWLIVLPLDAMIAFGSVAARLIAWAERKLGRGANR